MKAGRFLTADWLLAVTWHEAKAYDPDFSRACDLPIVECYGSGGGDGGRIGLV